MGQLTNPIDLCLSADGTRLFFSKDPSTGTLYDIFETPAVGGAYAIDAAVGRPEVSSPDYDYCGSLSANGTMYLYRLAGLGLYVAPRLGASFGAPVRVRGFGSGDDCAGCWDPIVSRDERTILFSRPDAGVHTIFQARRNQPDAAFGTSTALNAFTGTGARPEWLSPDGCRLYFAASGLDGGAGSTDLYVASRPK
jgi:hypothetical protein